MFLNVLITLSLMVGFVVYLLAPLFMYETMKVRKTPRAYLGLTVWYAFWPLYLFVSVVR